MKRELVQKIRKYCEPEMRTFFEMVVVREYIDIEKIELLVSVCEAYEIAEKEKMCVSKKLRPIAQKHGYTVDGLRKMHKRVFIIW